MPELYHHAIETQVVAGLTGVRSVMDDFLVHGKHKVEHDSRLEAFLVRLEEKNLM